MRPHKRKYSMNESRLRPLLRPGGLIIALPREELGRAVPCNRGTSSISKFESFAESSLGYFKKGPTAFY